MSSRRIQVEAIEARAEPGTCPGMARTRQGETFTLGARTPEGRACVLTL
jgi:hypothetical protein